MTADEPRDEAEADAADHADETFGADDVRFDDAAEAVRWANVPENHRQLMLDAKASVNGYIDQLNITTAPRADQFTVDALSGCDQHTMCIGLSPTDIKFAKQDDAELTIDGVTRPYHKGMKQLAHDIADRLPKQLSDELSDGTQVRVDPGYTKGHFHVVLRE